MSTLPLSQRVGQPSAFRWAVLLGLSLVAPFAASQSVPLISTVDGSTAAGPGLAQDLSEEKSPRLVPTLGHIDGMLSIGLDDSDRTFSAAFSPDGSLVTTASWDGTARIWEVVTGAEIRVLRGHTGGVRSVAFSADGTRVVTASKDGTARTWDALTGLAIHVFSDPNSPRGSVVISTDGTHIITADDSHVRVWDAEVGAADPRVFYGYSGDIHSATFSLAGDRIVAVGDDRAEVRSAELGTPTYLEGHIGRIYSATFNMDGTRIVTAGADGTARIWDAAAGVEIARIEEDDEIRSAAFSPDGSHIVTASRDGTARVWDVATGEESMRLGIHEGAVGSATFSSDGSRVVTTERSDKARVWDVVTGSELSVLRGNVLRVSGASFSRGGAHIVTRNEWLFTLMWDARTGDLSHLLRGQTDGIRVVTAERDTTWVWDVVTGNVISMLSGHISPLAYLAFSPNGDRVITVGLNGRAHVWNTLTGDEESVLPEEILTVHASAFSPDGAWVAAVSRDGSARVWSADTGAEVLTLNDPVPAEWFSPADLLAGRTTKAWTVAFSADGARVVTSHEGGEARVWDAMTGKELRLLRGHTAEVRSAAFSPTGARVVTASKDGTARIWDSETGDSLLVLTGHTFDVSSAAFSPDEGRVITASMDGTVRIWDAATGDELAQMLQFRRGSWLVVTPDGRFDAPDLERISGAVWVAPDDPLTPLPIEAFMRDFYEPRLLSRVLAGETFPDMGSLLDRNRVQPTVEITATEATGGGLATVTVEVEGRARTYGGEERRSGVHDLRLFRDGRLVAWRDGALLDGTGRQSVTFEGVPLPSGADSVAFSAYAFNADRVKSRTTRAALTVPARPARPRRAFVVSLGVDAFADPEWNLSFAAADARATTGALGATLAATGDYAEVVTVALVSERGGADHGTAAALRGALLRLSGAPLDAAARDALAAVPGADRLAQATPDDAVIVTASTHGYADSTGVFYLLPSDIPVTGRRLTPELLAAAVSSDELSAWLRGVDAGALAVVVDACNAAGAVEGTGFKPGPMGARGLGQLAFDKGAAVLTATQADAPAFEAGATGRGLLTFALIENGLLDGQADAGGDADGTTTLAEWLAYGAARVPGLTAEVRSGTVERGGGLRARQMTDEEASARPDPGLQTPALFDFRRSTRPVAVSSATPEPDGG